ncbi:hypothetical protein HYT26_03485 [Candidatus Pacearchaeota archaeon]|nr:hypothetical protein [Candidatus Pacearchaeota archaeon]
MKKGFVLFSVLLIGIIISSYFVSAQTNIGEGVKELVENVIAGGEPIFSALLGEVPAGQYLFAKILFLIIILSIVWIVLDQVEIFSENTWALAIISIAVSILSTRFLATTNIVDFILLPYNVFGVALSTLIPLIIYFYVVGKAIPSQTIRKIAWILAAAVFFGLWLTRRTDIGNLAWIYLAAAMISLIFLLADKTIKRYFVKADMDAWGSRTKKAHEIEIKRKMQQANTDLTGDIITPKQHDKIIKDLRKQLVALQTS